MHMHRVNHQLLVEALWRQSSTPLCLPPWLILSTSMYLSCPGCQAQGGDSRKPALGHTLGVLPPFQGAKPDQPPLLNPGLRAHPPQSHSCPHWCLWQESSQEKCTAAKPGHYPSRRPCEHRCEDSWMELLGRWSGKHQGLVPLTEAPGGPSPYLPSLGPLTT